MDIGSVLTKAKSAKETIADAGLDKINDLLDGLNEALPKIKALGLSVKDFRIGQGAIPEVMIKLADEIDAIDSNRLQEIMDAHPDEKTLVTILKTLQAASAMKDRLDALDLKGVEAEVVLGLPPSVSVNFME